MNVQASITARLRATDPGMFVLKGALRAAIVVPLAFVLSLVVINSKQLALFAAFGSMAMLVFADFGGSRRVRLRAYLLLVAAGAVLIVLGTLCSRSTWLATIAMGFVAFAILFAGVLDDYVVAARAAVTLTFVLPVMVPADAAEIPTRLAGWGLAGALCIPAALLLWPARPRSVLRREVAQAARSLAELVEATSRSDRPAADTAAQSTHAATVVVRGRFVSMTQRPSGTTGPTAALARLIEDLSWVLRIAERPSTLASTAAPCPTERYAIEARTATALREIAAQLESSGGDLPLELARLREAHNVFGRAQLEHFEQMQPDRDEAEAEIELDEAYRLRALSFGVLQAGKDALQACEDHARATPAQTKTTSGQTLRTRIHTARRLMRAHTSTRSVWLRNSLRWAIGLALAVLVGQLADLQNSFWIVLGTMSVLRSSALSTSATIASALLGTLAGIVIGGLIVVAVGADHGVLWAVLPFAVLLAAYAPQAISFAAGQGAFTIVVLVLFNLIEPAGWKVGLVRVEDVAVGAGVSLLVGLLLWPRGATSILRGAIGAAYNGAAHYLDATITALLDGGEQAHSMLAAREAFDTEQLLDAAIRDYLANRGSARGRINELTLLATGASRVRRIARLLQDAHSFMRLAPIDDTLPRLVSARDALDAERRARCEWYESFGKAIAQAASSPDAELSGAGATAHPSIGELSSAGTTTHTPIGELSSASTTAHTPVGEVVLEHVGGGDSLQPGLAIAWARRHLHVLAELELMLSSAYGRISL